MFFLKQQVISDFIDGDPTRFSNTEITLTPHPLFGQGF
jgi:hypothetical protein